MYIFFYCYTIKVITHLHLSSNLIKDFGNSGCEKFREIVLEFSFENSNNLPRYSRVFNPVDMRMDLIPGISRKPRFSTEMENGKWKMENGKWEMGNGKWKMENGKWKMENDFLEIFEFLPNCLLCSV